MLPEAVLASEEQRGDTEHRELMKSVAREHGLIRLEAFQLMAPQPDWHRAYVIELPTISPRRRPGWPRKWPRRSRPTRTRRCTFLDAGPLGSSPGGCLGRWSDGNRLLIPLHCLGSVESQNTLEIERAMDIRKATDSDVAEVRTCALDAYRTYTKRIGRPPAPLQADYADQVREGQVFVVGQGQVVVGFVVFYPRGDHLHLENVAVRPTHQGRGYGGRLVAFVEERAQRYGLAAVELYTNEKMHENIDMYRKLGYVECARRNVDGYDRVFFRKTL